MTYTGTVARLLLILLLYMLCIGAACGLIWTTMTDQDMSTAGPRRTRPGGQP